MSKSSKHVFFAVTVIIWGIVLLLCTCGTKKQADNIVLSIDVPSEDNIPMPTGRSFFVSGKISPAEPVPENAVLEVEMLDQTGKVLRHIAGTKKDPSKFYVYPEMTDSFCTDREQIQNSLNNFVRCEYLVDDPSAPDLSFRNAEIKCCIDGDTFWALIVGGTDEEHGAAVDDGCHFTAADGSPYNVPPVGEYILRVSLKDKNGEKLSTAEKPLVIGDSENALIMRFHPDRYLNYMTTEIRKLIDYQTNVDYIPGFLVGIDGNAVSVLFGSCWQSRVLYHLLL